MRKKIIYISFIRLTDKTSRDWFVDYLISRGIDVEYWDVVGVLRENYYERAAKLTNYLHIISSYVDLERRIGLQENKKAHYIILVSYAAFTIKFYRLMTKYNCNMYYFLWGAVPLGSRIKIKSVSLLLTRPIKTLIKIYSKVITFSFRYFKLIKPFNVVFAAGEVMLNAQHYAKKVVPINFSDYTQFLKTQTEGLTLLVSSNYAVFLDVYLPFHPDAALLGWSTVNPEKYFESLNNFFVKLEKKYNIQIVIAAHPRSDYRNENPFCGRKIFFEQTPQLVKDAQFVLSHSSISQSYAILNKKQIIFIYTDEMVSVYKNTEYLYEIYDAASYLNAPLYNIDKINSYDEIIIGDIDEVRYEFYKYSYLVSRQCEGEQTQDLFWREIMCGED
jgi:hypothetical protein